MIRAQAYACGLVVEEINMDRYDIDAFGAIRASSRVYLNFNNQVDVLQELIDSKIEIHPITISGKWCEIDTEGDLARARKIFL